MSAHPLTDKALLTLRALAEGNGLDPNKIELIGAEEKPMVLRAEMHLNLDVPTTRTQRPGKMAAPRKGAPLVQTLPSVEAIGQRVAEMKTTLLEGSKWIDEAIEQLKNAPGQGFGMESADITLESLAQTFGASEGCRACYGQGALACQACRGTGGLPCNACQSTGQELCHYCQGTGRHPSLMDQNCPVCNGQARITCRSCFGRRQISCQSCGGKGQTICATCKGQGSFVVEERALPTVRCSFRVVDSADLPSGLRHALDRGGLKLLL
ncbi:MAG TPA: hypothetical protein VHB73_03625, partial [Alphaproteobacteria bacterium]|nr:hypothetical protein [Alphaproteobacteria bacterium]